MEEEKIVFLGTKEVAHALGCSLAEARKTMLRADFPLLVIGKSYKVNRKSFIDWSSKRRV